jgi:hypothetical protein
MSRRRARRLAAVTLTAGLVTAVASAGGPLARGAQEVAFDAVGEATGVEVTISNPTIPAGIVIEGSGPTAQARLSSLGTSDAFAALPYPGDTAANLPGTVTALTSIPLPDYPFYVHSENGTPPKDASYVGQTLHAESTGNRSSAKATAGQDATGYYAETTIGQDSDGSVTVDSVAKQNGLDIGGLVTLSGVVTTAQAVLDSSGVVTTKSSLVVGRFDAPAMRVTIPSQVCVPTQPCQPIPAPFGGQTLANPDLGFDAKGFYIILPIAGPQRFPIPTQTGIDALATAGITATYQQPITTKNSVVAASLTLRTTLPSLPNNPGLNGPTPVTYVLGRAQASVSGQLTADDSSDGPTIPIVDPGTAGSPLTPLLPGGTSVPPLQGAGLPGTTPSDLGGQPPTVSGPQGGSGQPQPPTTLASSRLPLHSVFWFYLVLVGVGLVGSIAGQVLRYVGVRSSWAS